MTSLYDATDPVHLAHCLCGHSPAVAKDEDMDGYFYEVECETCELRVDGRTLDRAVDAWAEAVRRLEIAMADRSVSPVVRKAVAEGLANAPPREESVEYWQARLAELGPR